LADKKKILILDRFRSPGSHGIMFTEIRNILYGEKPKVSGFVLGHEDVFHHDIKKMVEKAKREDQFEEWYNVGMPDERLKAAGEDNYQRLRRGEKFVRQDVKEGPLIVPGTNVCQGCTPMLAVRQVIETVGNNCVVPVATGCIMAAMGVWPLSSFKVAGGHYCFTNLASIASGIEAARKRQQKDYTILAIGGDGGLGDIGFGALSGAVERGHRIVYVCYDNEAYMTTGVQRSGSTSYLAKTKTTPWGKEMKKKDLAGIVAANGAVYVATASTSYLPDLRKKVLKAKEADGPAFIHILCPCPTGWELDPALAIKVGKLAVETGSWILYESENGKRTITKAPKKRIPVKEYLNLQGRFSHLTDSQIAEIQTDVDKRWQELVEGQY
jgi:pyruvate ferredoxin oxidoreductase beta subunit